MYSRRVFLNIILFILPFELSFKKLKKGTISTVPHNLKKTSTEESTEEYPVYVKHKW